VSSVYFVVKLPSLSLADDGGDGGANFFADGLVEAVDFVVKEEGVLRPVGDVHPLDIYTY